MPTIYTLAKALGVSTATVSRALNNSQLVNQDVRDRVLEKAKELGYKPRKIKRQRERLIITVKLILPHHEDPVRGLFYSLSDLVEGLKAGLSPSPVNIICEMDNNLNNLFGNKKSGSVDCILFAFSSPSQKIIEATKDNGVPALTLNRSVKGLTSMCEDSDAAMMTLVRHLEELEPGRPIKYIGDGPNKFINKRRISGFIEACKELDVAFDPEKDMFQTKSYQEINLDVLKTLGAEPCTYVCSNDVVGSLVMNALHRGGYKIPEDRWVTGFGASAVADVCRPKLTSMRVPVRRLAKAAGEYLLKRVLEHESMPMKATISGELWDGESTPQLTK